MNVELIPKYLQLLHELVPGATRIADLYQPGGAVSQFAIPAAQAAARSLGLELSPISRTA